MLDCHHKDEHGQQIHHAGGGGGGHDAGGVGGGGKSRLERIPRPSISMGSSQQDFKIFYGQWKRYKRSSGETDSDKLRDQLMYC